MIDGTLRVHQADLFYPLSARIFTDLGLLELIRGQSVTQGSMSCDPPRYPPRGPGDNEKVKFPER